MAYSGRNGKITAIELVFLGGIVCMVFLTLVPQSFRIRDAVRVELTARELERCDHVVDEWIYEGAFHTNRVPLATIDEAIAHAGKKPLAWPSVVRLDTFEKSGTNRASVVVLVHGGEHVVTSADLEGVNHAN